METWSTLFKPLYSSQSSSKDFTKECLQKLHFNVKNIVFLFLRLFYLIFFLQWLIEHKRYKIENLKGKWQQVSEHDWENIYHAKLK